MLRASSGMVTALARLTRQLDHQAERVFRRLGEHGRRRYQFWIMTSRVIGRSVARASRTGAEGAQRLRPSNSVTRNWPGSKPSRQRTFTAIIGWPSRPVAAGEGLDAAGPAEQVMDAVLVEEVVRRRVLATLELEPRRRDEAEERAGPAAHRAVAAQRGGLPVELHRVAHRSAVTASPPASPSPPWSPPVAGEGVHRPAADFNPRPGCLRRGFRLEFPSAGRGAHREREEARDHADRRDRRPSPPSISISSSRGRCSSAARSTPIWRSG